MAELVDAPVSDAGPIIRVRVRLPPEVQVIGFNKFTLGNVEELPDTLCIKLKCFIYKV